jgi:putative DNA-invertase from lambdoid prophage Rac
MSNIAYFRTSTHGQSIESQRTALGAAFDEEFKDEGVSGSVMAAERPGFAAMLKFIRKGDTLYVYAIDRLGRDSIDIQTNVKALQTKGVQIHVHGLGVLVGDAGTLIMTLFAQLAEMEKARILERTEAGRVTAREHLARTGKTQHGKTSLGRPFKVDGKTVKAWRDEDKANRSIADTAAYFGISPSSVKRHCAA